MCSRRTILGTIVLVLLPCLLWSQEQKVDLLIREAEEQEAIGSSAGIVLAHWLQVYDAVQEAERHPQLPRACRAIGDIYSQEQLNVQALPYYQQAAQVLAADPAQQDEWIRLQRKVAQTYAQLAKPDSAALFYQEILAQKEQTNNLNGQLNTLQDIAQAYSMNGAYEEALLPYQQMEQLMEAQQRPDQERLLLYNNLGYTYNLLDRYEEAIEYFEKAVELLPEEDLPARTILHTNIGIAQYNLGEFSSSIDELLEARKLQARHSPQDVDKIDQLLASVYLQKQDYHNGLTYANQSRERAMSNQNHLLLVDVYYTSALIHSELYEYDLALEYFQEHLRLRDSFALAEKLRQEQLLLQQINLERTESQVKLFQINEDVKNLEIAQLRAEAENQQLTFENQSIQLLAEQKEKEILRKDNELQASELRIQESETARARQQLELARQRLLASEQEQENAALQRREALQQLEINEKETQLQQEQNENELLLRDQEISTLELQKQEERVEFFYGIGALMALILLIIAGGLIYSRRLNRELNQKNAAIEKQKAEIDLEKEKSDNLLLNILPEQVATELKETGRATTKKYDNVTILFTDFKDFTVLVASIPSTTLIKELNDIFSHFDDIMEEYEIEKIETIGDAYMAACGLPVENTDHAIRCVHAANKMLAYLDERNSYSEIKWRMRVGIHSGPVVAGVVGKKKFAYDLFGDTVNTASRIETNGEAGRINISHTTYELVKDSPELTFEDRGHIHAKGKGMLNMWFVNN